MSPDDAQSKAKMREAPLKEEIWRYMLGIPPLRPIALQHYKKEFDNNITENLFTGIFESFDEAQSAIPNNRRTGYDNVESANLPYTSAVANWDWPAMFWLLKAFDKGYQSVFDLGGHTGIKYYAFRRAIGYPEGLRWLVCDVPAVISKGREVAIARDPERRLSFTKDFTDIQAHEILYASGSLQYLPKTLSELLIESGHRPRRIIINITPLHPEHAYFTLNNIGSSICPYRVQARDQFVKSILTLGYIRAGEWENIGKSLFLPESSKHGIPNYSGFCFDLASPA